MNNKCEDFANLEDLDIDLGKLGKASVLPDFTEYETYLDLNERILYLDFDINDALVDYSRRIIRWNRQDRDIPVEERKPIKLLINSYGGSLDSCFVRKCQQRRQSHYELKIVHSDKRISCCLQA